MTEGFYTTDHVKKAFVLLKNVLLNATNTVE